MPDSVSGYSFAQARAALGVIEGLRSELPPVVRATEEELSIRAELAATESAAEPTALEVLVKPELPAGSIEPLYETVPELSRCPCGKMVPISLGVLPRARAHSWFRVHRGFNKVFYRLLAGMGVSGAVTLQALILLSKHRGKRHLDLTPQQTRGAWGLQCGVFTAEGRIAQRAFRRLGGRAALEVEMMLSRGEGSHAGEIEFGCEPGLLKIRPLRREEWPELEAEALSACCGKAKQADFQTEVKWILSKAREWPDFHEAPSQIAIKTWLILNDPVGADPLLRDLLKMTWSKRMSAGEGGRGKIAEALFDADRVPDASAADQDKDLEARLFGGGV